jgi:tricarballylate dehydrogenase
MSDGRGNTMNRYDYQYGITVNALGQRFFDEGEAKHAYTYAKTGRAVLNQPGGVAWQLYDQTGIDYFRHGRDYPATMVEAPTLAELANKVGIEPEPMLRTIEEFNAACRADIPFMAGDLDGKCTIGITPKKSNWAVPLIRGPFRAYPITAGVTFSFGGVQVDTQARVINTSHQPIEGLFASGDIIGLFFHNYPSCTGQTRNAVFSLLAGRNAAAMQVRN